MYLRKINQGKQKTFLNVQVYLHFLYVELFCSGAQVYFEPLIDIYHMKWNEPLGLLKGQCN